MATRLLKLRRFIRHGVQFLVKEYLGQRHKNKHKGEFDVFACFFREELNKAHIFFLFTLFLVRDIDIWESTTLRPPEITLQTGTYRDTEQNIVSI